MQVVLGLSGGVDSALAAALLRERGVGVHGVYLKVDDGSGDCPAREDIAMCRRVAAHLDVPFMVRDVTAHYEERVLAPMVRAYAGGSTPNPDTACNRWVKFDTLRAVANELGVAHIATGHYARLRRGTRRTSPERVDLLRGVDAEKDQSYFLWELTQAQLRAVLFPIGVYTKTQVRAMARARGLPNWDRKSTRGVCFLGGTSVASYLAARLAPEDATVMTTHGERLGRVPFAQAYTVGQRIRLGGQPVPRYVVARQPLNGTIIVSDERDDPARYTMSVRARSPRWFAVPPGAPFACSARIRHGQEPQSCVVRVAQGRVDVAFDVPQIGVAPGQAVVFTDGDRVLGGAVIA